MSPATTFVVRRFLLLAVLTAAALAVAGASGKAHAESLIFKTTLGGLAIHGTDPVAYFTDKKPVEGKKEFSYDWMGATWRFASAEHLAMFKADPEKYAPQFGGYCAYAVSQGSTAKSEPEDWTIVDNKLYLNYNDKVQKIWLQDRDKYIKDAQANWPKIKADLK